MVGTKDAVRPPRGKPDDKEKRSPLSRLRLNYSFLQVGSGDRKHHEPEYEEVGPPTGLRKNTDNGTKGDGVHCDLCGSAPAAVRCDRCGSQTFCLSCDDMYHRHPRRSSHVRKAVDSKAPSGGGVRPPLPPKGDTQGAPPPQPPPRKNKRSGFGFSKKDQNYHSYSGGLANITSRSSSMTNLQSAASDSVSGAGRTIMGSLKKFMGARPLPPTPDQVKASAKNDNRDSVPSKALIRASTSPSLPNLSDQTNDDIRAGLPQSILELNRSRPPPKNSTSTPATPASPNAQYPPLQPKTQQPHAHTHSLGRKFSLQQLPQAGMEDKRTSLVEPSPGGVGWESETPKPMPRNRSQSISDDQWAQVMASQGGDGTGGPSGPSCPPGHTPADMSAFVGATTRRGYNTMGGRGSSFGRGMVSSASVCDLNSLAQQQPPHGFNSSHPASSFQQLNMMGYPGGMPMWGAPCDLCTPAHMLAGQANVSGMKRTASNLSMNLSSVGSDVTGYPWGPPPPHMHHHMPPMFPGYYPGYHPHMGPPAMGSLNMSIPDSMNTFGKVPSSPAPSLRSSSHRSHKSSKSRSFSGADVSGRRSRNRRKQRSEESEESRSSSVSDDDDDGGGRNNKVGSSLAWQCDHCTFINSGGVRTCGMCSKTMGGGGGGGGSGRSSRRGSERHRSDRRRDRRTDHEDDDRDVSDYDNDGGVVKSNLSFNIKDNRRESRTKVSNSSKSKSKKKSRRRGSSASASESASDGEEERLERHMRDLRVSSSSRRRGSDYESVSNKDRDRDRDRDRDKGSRKREGGSSRFKNRGKSHSERSRTPGRQTPRRESPVEDAGSRGGSRERSPTEDSRSSHHSPSEDRNDHNSSHEDTVVNTVASEVTAKSEHKSKSDSSKRSRSRARSQAEEVADEVQVQVEAAPVEQEPLEAKSRTPSPRQQARNSKSPAPSQRDGDEHSFANTLDEITTMGTNEMADQDLSSHYIDERIIMQPAEAHDEIPEVIFVRPKTPDEEAVAEKATAAADQLMAVNGETNVAEVQPAVPEPVVKPISRIPPSEPVYEPRYEPIEEPVLNEPAVAAAEPDSEQPDYQTATMGMSAGDKEPLGDRDDEQGGDDTLVEATRPMAVADVRGGEGLRSGSSGSSLGINNTPPDRQYTPLSFSSSDAQFYSPPDSPDISLSEQLQDKPLPSNTQTVKAHSDDYLVSALETMQTAQTGDDLKSSRETIRSSFEQLPYSEEAFEREAEAPARPASAGAAVPPTDGYESLSFKDALTSSEASRKQQQTPPDKAERQSKALEAEVSEKHMTVEQIINKRRQETMERQGLELVQTLRSAEEAGYTTEDVSIALAQSGDKNPLEWLKENWRHMVDTVLTLATNYGHERRVNDVGAITAAEAKSALRVHKGNIWAAVTECVEQRQKKFNDILSRGNFQRQEVVRALETNDGDADAALQELNKPQQHQPFTMKIWAPPQAPEGQTPKPVSSAHAQVEVQDAPPAPPSPPPPAPPPPPPAPVEPPAAPPTIAGTKQGTDVVVHPLKAFTHYADLSISEFSEDPHNPDAISPLPHEALPPHPDALAHTPFSPRGAAEARPRAGEAPREVPTSGTHALSESAAPDARPKKNYRKYSSTLHVTLSSRKPEPSPIVPAKPFDSHKSEPDLRSSDAYESISSGQAKQEEPLHSPDSRAPRPESRSAPSSVRNSLLLGDYDASDEEDSVSITTGRLSLSFSSDGVNVKSELVQTEQVAASEHEAALEKAALGDEDEDNTETCVSNPLEEDGSLEERVRMAERSDKKAGEVSRFEEPGMAQTRPGPVTMQKATAIVGKAIAKAMARETSVRESLSRSVTPEIGQDAPMVTPEPSEEEEETVGQAPITDSEDDDHLRTLDTIPEEEEISEMTESGRIISRSASKNLFLPFNPTDVVHLNAVGRGVATAAAASPRPSASSTVKVASDEKSGTPSEAGRPASIPERADESVSEAPHNYYNDPKYNYYNAAAGAEDAPAEEPPVKLAPNDYETMYEVKRELDSLRDTSEVTMGKLNALITNEAQDARDNDDEGIYYEEVVLKSGIDPSSQAKTEAGSEPSTTTPSRRRRRRRRRGRGQGEGGEAGASRADQSEPSAPASSSLSSAPPPQAPADTSPPPPETTPSASPAESSPAQAEAEASPSASNPVLLDPAETPAEAATTKAAGGRRRARLSDSKTYSMIEIVSTKTKEEAADSSQPAEGAASTAAGTRRRRPRTAAGAADAGSSSTTNQSSDYAAATASTTSSTRTRSRARVSESSGDSEDDDRPSRVSEEDPSKIPHLLVQIEGLKARQKKESDYQEVRELKEQIQQMRKQLEAKMEEEGKRPDTPETPKDEHPPPGPLADPQEPAEEQTKMTSPEEEQLNFDRTVRRLLAEGHAGSYEKAELAAHLMNFSFDEANSLQAAEECSSIYTALQFLQQECELCAEKYPMGKMVSMLQCTHRCCCECAKTYYTFQIKTKNIRDLRCPFCNEPDLDACEEIANEYLNNMDILLKTILDSETHELFQRKLRDWTLMKDPNFRWCNKCSSGFIANPRARKLICPDCKDVTCASCRAPWEASHEGISCEAFARWKNDNDLEAQAQGVAKHLAECGITCPKCKFTYALAKGGCMHFTCTQCKYEFCSGCGQPFRQGSKCPVGPYCERLGLHSHHPRNCLFYLRDKEPHQLQNLLKEAGITYDTEPPEMWEPGKSCQVQEQKELPDGLKDDVCGRTVPNGYAGLCRIHFVEYLAWLIFKNKIDPLETLDEEDLRFVIRRENLAAPKRIPWESKDAYRQKLLQLIKEHLPLDSTV
ncbi:E3 ubiquitin-protein ligase lubel-like isoform X9 [Penaeus chinensis]|uniref:E3 ubiquitin-protein ligase lubel-like isoform X9 n=1 Tax=Penaeus chinensis TaxID=139456 RepID=UPI001FB66537|nr:E3 ubiquitin-protein ligase lubel-like isoform X9 [Penaeus chinensis]